MPPKGFDSCIHFRCEYCGRNHTLYFMRKPVSRKTFPDALILTEISKNTQ